MTISHQPLHDARTKIVEALQVAIEPIDSLTPRAREYHRRGEVMLRLNREALALIDRALEDATTEYRCPKHGKQSETPSSFCTQWVVTRRGMASDDHDRCGRTLIPVLVIPTTP